MFLAVKQILRLIIITSTQFVSFISLKNIWVVQNRIHIMEKSSIKRFFTCEKSVSVEKKQRASLGVESASKESIEFDNKLPQSPTTISATLSQFTKT